MVEKSRVEKFMVEKFMVEKFMVEKLMVELSGVEKFLSLLRLKSVGLKIPVLKFRFEKSRVGMSWLMVK